MNPTQPLTLDQVAEILSLKPVTIKRYAREGLLDCQEQQGQMMFEADKVDKFKEIQAKLR